MAKAIANCTCEFCGASFQKSTIKPNARLAADWVKWAEANITLCPECYGKTKEFDVDERITALEKVHPLPEITGASEKQIKFASDMRRKFLRNKLNCQLAENAVKVMAETSPDAVKRYAEERGVPEADAWETFFKDKSQLAVYIVLTSSEARKVLDALLND